MTLAARHVATRVQAPGSLFRRASLAVVLAVLAAGCGAATTSEPDGAAATDAEQEQFPVTISSCGQDVTFDAAPERILALGRAEMVAILSELGELDRVVGRAGAYPPAYFDAATNEAIAAVPSLGDDLDEAGHLQISQEVILDLEPDLVLGIPDGVDAQGLRTAGIAVLEQEGNCPEGLEEVGFAAVYDEVEKFGAILGVPEAADEVVEELRGRVAHVEEAAAEVGDGRVAAALFPTIGGGTTFAYGNRSFAHVLLETAGFTNAFADVDERVFEVATEELLAQDPQALLLLHVDGDPDAVVDAARQLPGADGMRALTDEQVLVALLNFGEYPSPLVIDGLEQLVATFGDR